MAEKARRTQAAGRGQQWAVRGEYGLDRRWNAWPRRGVLLRTAPRDCMTEPETGCSCRISCTRGSIPRITCMRPVGLFRRIFGEYSTSPLQSLLIPRLQSPSSDGETTVPSLLIERQADEQEPPSTWESHRNTLFHYGTPYSEKCRGSSLPCKLLFVHYLAPSYIRTALYYGVGVRA